MRFEDGSHHSWCQAKTHVFSKNQGTLQIWGVFFWGYIFLMDLISGRNDAMMQSSKGKVKQDAKEESSYLWTEWKHVIKASNWSNTKALTPLKTQQIPPKISTFKLSSMNQVHGETLHLLKALKTFQIASIHSPLQSCLWHERPLRRAIAPALILCKATIGSSIASAFFTTQDKLFHPSHRPGNKAAKNKQKVIWYSLCPCGVTRLLTRYHYGITPSPPPSSFSVSSLTLLLLPLLLH